MNEARKLSWILYALEGASGNEGARAPTLVKSPMALTMPFLYGDLKFNL